MNYDKYRKLLPSMSDTMWRDVKHQVKVNNEAANNTMSEKAIIEHLETTYNWYKNNG